MMKKEAQNAVQEARVLALREATAKAEADMLARLRARGYDGTPNRIVRADSYRNPNLDADLAARDASGGNVSSVSSSPPPLPRRRVTEAQMRLEDARARAYYAQQDAAVTRRAEGRARPAPAAGARCRP